ncbi:hypothetical protein V496_10046 [Pseudogymnoascus sp. VKM F-4515 (FW-2607)]|nr:hypothetical protein V496_10046 [Pseudogymnoascus sp. VKM F-4515 (FW-2607)]KFY76951.1 hypothetical protein V498_09476 [Pseudogymnoascus sp. VKM F-4517 (FW-2822)]
MAKPTSSDGDFGIHVDGSCLTNSTDLHASPKRNLSDQTVIHHDGVDEKTEQEEHTEALIHAAARAIITSIEQDAYDKHAGSAISDLSYSGVDGTENCYTEGSNLTYGEETEMSYGEGTEMSYEGDQENSYNENIHDDPYDGSASSHHEDDVFSDGRRSSGGSLNSSDEQNTDEERRYQLTKSDNKAAQTETRNGEQEDELNNEMNNLPETISRIPSMASNTYSMLPEPLSFSSITSPHTPSKVLSRPPFRTPSSVRAMQMSSPTPSVFSGSPTSRKRVNSSRLGTPNKLQSSLTKHRTPTKFKAKEEHPLVLLHVTVLPLHWQHAQIMDTAPPDVLSKDLLAVRESWKMLREKLGDTVFERGVLLPHPQDSYETLEERLCAALELPMRPRAKILACGHYIGPSTSFSDSELSSSDSSDSEDLDSEVSTKSLWCDICCRDVRFGKYDSLPGRQKKSFKVKLFASNGLMGAGAWAACWREMERVDVEITPWVEAAAAKEINELTETVMAAHQTPDEGHFEEGHHSIMEEPVPSVKIEAPEEESHVDFDDIARSERDAMRLREIYGEQPSQAPEQVPHPQHDPHQQHERPSSRRPTARHQQDESFVTLLVAAVKVLVQDKKNVMIFLLSLVVLLLAVRPGGAPPANSFQMQELAMQKFEAAAAARAAADVVQPTVQMVAKVEQQEIHTPEQAPVQVVIQPEVVEEKREVPTQVPMQAPAYIEVVEAKVEVPAPATDPEQQIVEAVPASEEEVVVEAAEPVQDELSAPSIAEEIEESSSIPQVEATEEVSSFTEVSKEAVDSSEPVAESEPIELAKEASLSSVVLEEVVESIEPAVETEPVQDELVEDELVEAEPVNAETTESEPVLSEAEIVEPVSEAVEEQQE